MRNLFSFGLIGASLALAGCGATADSDQGTDAADPEAVFFALEERLASSNDIRIEFHVTAEGAVEVDLVGDLRISATGVTQLSSRGLFAGEQVDLSLRSEGGEYQFGNGQEQFTSPTPQRLNEALLIGFTRMGILHNLAMLVGSAPPDGADGADGGVREWVVVDSFEFERAEVDTGKPRVVSFSMTVSGVPAGSVELEISQAGYPMVRRQTVQFPAGEMHVVERYSRVSIVP